MYHCICKNSYIYEKDLIDHIEKECENPNYYNHSPLKKKYVSAPERWSSFKSRLSNPDIDIKGAHGTYLTDIFNQIYRMSDIIKILASKYPWDLFVDIVWFDISFHTFQIKDNVVYFLGKVECENAKGMIWFGDSYTLNEDDRVIKCYWYKDSDLKSTFSNFRVLVKEMLNFYLKFACLVLKKEKIKIRDSYHKQEKTIEDCLEKHKLNHLVSNLKNLNCYTTFYNTFYAKINNIKPIIFTNVNNVFIDEPINTISDENQSIMCLSDYDLRGYYKHLMMHVLTELEQALFLSKII